MGSSGSKNNHEEKYTNLRDHPTDIGINRYKNNDYNNCVINNNKNDNNKKINIIKDLEIVKNKNNDKIEIYKEKALQRHNELRHFHGSDDLKINQDLNKMAQEKAHNLIENQNNF